MAAKRRKVDRSKLSRNSLQDDEAKLPFLMILRLNTGCQIMHEEVNDCNSPRYVACHRLDLKALQRIPDTIGSPFIVVLPVARVVYGDLTCVDDRRGVRPVPIIAASIIFRITRE